MVKRNKKKNKKNHKWELHNLLVVSTWLAGFLAFLAIGFALIEQTITFQYISETISVIAGWVIVVLTLISAIISLSHLIGS